MRSGRGPTWGRWAGLGGARSLGDALHGVGLEAGPELRELRAGKDSSGGRREVGGAQWAGPEDRTPSLSAWGAGPDVSRKQLAPQLHLLVPPDPPVLRTSRSDTLSPGASPPPARVLLLFSWSQVQ